MRAVFLVFIGGGVGSLLRWLTGQWALRAFGAAFPFGTLIVNILGCFAMGLLFHWTARFDADAAEMRLLLMTGLLGGFTTFSAFALDAAALWMRGAHGEAALYVGLSIVASLIGIALGLATGKWVAA